MVLGAVKLSLSVIRDKGSWCLLSIWHSEPGLSVEAVGLASCCQQLSHWGQEGGGVCCDRGRPASRIISSLPVKASSPGTHYYFSSISTCSSRNKRHWLSVTSSQSMRELFFRMYLSCPGKLDMFKKCFSWASYTEVVWRWVISNFLSQSERVLCSQWIRAASLLCLALPENCMVRSWEASAPGLKMSNPRFLDPIPSSEREGASLGCCLLGPFPVSTRGQSVPVTSQHWLPVTSFL